MYGKVMTVEEADAVRFLKREAEKSAKAHEPAPALGNLGSGQARARRNLTGAFNGA